MNLQIRKNNAIPIAICISIFLAAANINALEVGSFNNVQMRIDGFVFAQYYYDTNNNANSHHLNRVTAKGDTSRNEYSYDATRLNFNAERKKGDTKPFGRFEFDLQNPDVNYRIRHAVVGVKTTFLDLAIGQTDTLIGNLAGPHLFNNDWFWALGNSYDRMQQIRVSKNVGDMYFALAAVRNIVKPKSDQPPHAQARVNYKISKKAVIGLAGHYGTTYIKEIGVEGRLVSSLVALDMTIPLGTKSGMSFQTWYSLSGGHGTGTQEFGATYKEETDGLYFAGKKNKPVPIEAIGGFIEFHVRFDSISTAIAMGVNKTKTPNPVLKHNVTVGINLSYHFTKNFAWGIEVQWVESMLREDYIAKDFRYLTAAKFNF